MRTQTTIKFFNLDGIIICKSCDVQAIRFCLNIYRFLLGQKGEWKPPGDGMTGTSAMDKFLGPRGGNPQWAPIIEIVKFKDITSTINQKMHLYNFHLKQF